MGKLHKTGLAGEEFMPTSTPRAALVIVHGLGEHRGRYQTAADYLAKHGVACFTFDLRGHGESPGKRTYIDDFSQFATDMAIVVQAIRQDHSSLPLFVWGHSLGSIATLLFLIGRPTDIQGAIVTGCPLAAVPRGGMAVSGIAARLFGLFPDLRINSRLAPELLSHDDRVQAAYRDDPVVTKTTTVKLIFELFKAMRQIRRHAKDIDIPCLVVHGSDDKIAPPRGSKQLFEALGSKDKRLVIVPGSRHEVQNETGRIRDEFLDLVVRWICDLTAAEAEQP